MKTILLNSVIILSFLYPRAGWSIEDCAEHYTADLGVKNMGCSLSNTQSLSPLVQDVKDSKQVSRNKIEREENQNSWRDHKVYSSENAHCAFFDSGLNDNENCDEFTPSNGLNDFMYDSLSAVVSPIFLSQTNGYFKLQGKVDKCSCIYANIFSRNPGLKHEMLSEYIDLQTNKVTDKVLSSYGKKFLNQYSLYHEDMIYLLNQTNVISSKNKEEILCRGAEQFEKAVGKKCPGVNSKQLNERVNSLFSGAGELGKMKDLSSVLNYVDSATVQRSVSDKNGLQVAYSRAEFDKTRAGLTASPEFVFVDKVITGVLFKSERFRQGYVKGENGLDAISGFLAEQLNSNFDETFAKISTIKNSSKITEELAKLKNNPDGIIKYLKNNLLDAISVNPALHPILLDSEVFEKTLSATKGKQSESFMKDLQHFTFMEYEMRDRCNKMIEDFANVACLPREDIITKLPRESFNRLAVKGEEYIPGLSINDVLDCSTEQEQFSPFEDLSPDGKDIVNSDFMALLNGDKGKDSFSLFAESLVKNDDRAALITSATNVYYQQGGRSSVYDPVTKYASSSAGKIIDSSGKMSSQRSERRELNSEMHSQLTAQISNSQSQNAGNPQFRMLGNQQVNQIQNKNIVDLFSKREDKKEIEQHIAKIENSELKKLQEFKDSVMADKEADLKKQIETERKNLDELRLQIEKLTAGKNNVVNHNEQNARVKAPNNVSETTVSVNRGQISAGQPAFEAQTAKNSEVRGPASVAFSTGGAAMGAGNMARSIVQSAASAAPQIAKASANMGINVQDDKFTVGSSKELSDKIVDYLRNVDTETFLKFTKEGVLYKYKVVENGVEVEKEVYVSLSDLDSGLINEIIKDSEEKISMLERKYSFESLKMIITEEVTSRN